MFINAVLNRDWQLFSKIVLFLANFVEGIRVKPVQVVRMRRERKSGLPVLSSMKVLVSISVCDLPATGTLRGIIEGAVTAPAAISAGLQSSVRYWLAKEFCI